MIAHHRMVLPVILLSFAGYPSPAAARGSQSSNDPPWNSEHISRLPEEIRQANLRYQQIDELLLQLLSRWEELEAKSGSKESGSKT